MTQFSLADLECLIAERAGSTAAVSYTRALLDKGAAHCAKKMGEEAIETVLAAAGEDRERLISETGDLLYHVLVVLKARGVALSEVEAELERRTRQSGHAEKAARSSD